MHRFFLPSSSFSGDHVTVSSQDQLRHMKQVLRLRKGEQVCLFDEHSNEHDAVVDRIGTAGIALTVTARRRVSACCPVQLTIACALAKNAKMDGIIDTLTQLGVYRIIPLETDRVIVRWNASKKQKHLERWQSIAVSAVQQSQGASIPRLDPVTGFRDFISAADADDLKLIPTLSAGLPHIKAVIEAQHPCRVAVAIGPEGDFSPEEVSLAVSRGFLPVSLGSRVLRVDTAAAGIAAYLHFHAKG